MFVAVQQRRTPLAFLEFAERWPTLANESLEHGVRQLERRLVESRRTGIPIEHEPKNDHMAGTVRVVKHVDPEGHYASFGLEIASMRSVWMADFKRLLRDNAKTITGTRWQTVVPAAEEEWVLTDHPTLNIIYEGPGKYESSRRDGDRRKRTSSCRYRPGSRCSPRSDNARRGALTPRLT